MLRELNDILSIISVVPRITFLLFNRGNIILRDEVLKFLRSKTVSAAQKLHL